MPSSTSRPGMFTCRVPRAEPASRHQGPPRSRPSSSGTRQRSAISLRQARSNSTTFHPVRMSGSSSRTRWTIPAMSSFSEAKGRAPSGQAQPGGVNSSDSSAPQPCSPTASNRRPVGSVSMSIERTVSRGVPSAGTTSGWSNTTPTPGAARPSPRISSVPRMPRSTR